MKIKTGNEPVKKKKQQCITRPEVVVVKLYRLRTLLDFSI
jgi:hypothetical protein